MNTAYHQYRREMQKIPSSKAKSIGVSNFAIKNLEKLLNDPSCKTVPAVNQVEVSASKLFVVIQKS